MKVGEVEKVEVSWYVLSDNRVVSFHTAYTVPDRTQSVTFFSDSDTFPGVTAQKLGIRYFFMRNATREEADACIAAKELDVVKEILI